MKSKLRYLNGWKWTFGLMAVWSFVLGYSAGLWNAINCVVLVTAFFMLGRETVIRDLEIKMNKAKDETAAKKRLTV